MPLDNTIDYFERLNAQASKKADKSEREYLSAVKKLSKPVSKVENVIFDMVDRVSYPGAREDIDRVNRLERSAAFLGINKMSSAIGESIAAFAGVKPSSKSDNSLEYTLAQIEHSKAQIQKESDEFNKNLLKEAVRKDEKLERSRYAALNGLEGVMNSNKKIAATAQKLESDFINYNLKEQDSIAKERQKTQTNKSKQVKKVDNSVVRILDKNGKSIGLDQAEAAQFYQLGQHYNLDKPFREAKNERIRSLEYPVLIQRSYLIYERDKSQLDRLNKDIKDSEPFTLLTK